MVENFGTNFPVSDYYKSRIVDGTTITRKGNWWTAVLLLRDPKKENLFVKIYTWENRGGEWKVAQSFKLGNQLNATKIIETAEKFLSKARKDSRGG